MTTNNNLSEGPEESAKTIFDGTPDNVLFIPGKDPGVYPLETPDWFWRRVRGGRLNGVNLCQEEDESSKISRNIDVFKASKFEHIVEFNTVPVVLENAQFFRSYMGVHGKWILNGSAGDRFSTAHYMHQRFELDNPNFQPEFIEFVTTEGRGRSVKPLKVWEGSIDGLDHTIDCRGFHNYYHFVAETLAQLATVLRNSTEGRLLIHAGTKNVGGFVMKSIEAVFPDDVDRVELVDDTVDMANYERSLGLLHFRRLFPHLT